MVRACCSNQTLAKLYRPTSMFNWNGTALTGIDKIKDFREKLPPTKHDIQSYDCCVISDKSSPIQYFYFNF